MLLDNCKLERELVQQVISYKRELEHVIVPFQHKGFGYLQVFEFVDDHSVETLVNIVIKLVVMVETNVEITAIVLDVVISTLPPQLITLLVKMLQLVVVREEVLVVGMVQGLVHLALADVDLKDR